MAEKTPLRLACERYAGCVGSCPYDIHDLYEPWEESCSEKCSAFIDYAECWERYFIQQSEKGHLMDSNKDPIDKLRGWVRSTRADGLGPFGTNLEELDGIADALEAETAEYKILTTSYGFMNTKLNDALSAIRNRFGVDNELAAEDPAKNILEALERGWIRLPVDADGVPIRPGDLLVDTTSDYELYATKMFLGLNGWAINARRPDELRHVKPDTVEGLLAEFENHVRCDGADDASIAEYAERIRKAVQE